MTRHIMHPQPRFPHIISMKILDVKVINGEGGIEGLGGAHNGVTVMRFQGITWLEIARQRLLVVEIKKWVQGRDQNRVLVKTQASNAEGSTYKHRLHCFGGLYTTVLASGHHGIGRRNGADWSVLFSKENQDVVVVHFHHLVAVLHKLWDSLLYRAGLFTCTFTVYFMEDEGRLLSFAGHTLNLVYDLASNFLTSFIHHSTI